MVRQGLKKEDASYYEVVREGEENILFIYCEELKTAPSIEDSELCMSSVIDALAQVSGVTKIILSEKRDYEYSFDQTQMLTEIAAIYKRLARNKQMFAVPSSEELGTMGQKYLEQRFTELKALLFRMLKSDPVGSYIELVRALRRERISFDKTFDERFVPAMERYINVVDSVVQELEKTQIIQLAKTKIAGYRVGDRSLYRTLFSPSIKPDFMFTKLMASYPSDGEEIDSYTVGGDTEVTIFKFPDSVRYLYHMVPPEFKLSEEMYELLDMARKILAEHKPRKEEFTEPKRMRQVFANVGRDLLEDLATRNNKYLREKELDKLTGILLRYTVGFGLIEVLLEDEHVQDISINSPFGKVPIFLVHGKYSDCYTNIIPTQGEAESWATKMRLISGRPLDEADPILDTELELPAARTRVAVITRPLNPSGLAYSFRRHRSKPWTLPLFLTQKMITPIASGLISFLVDGTRTMLIAGTRSAGKSSLLASVMVEIMRRYRMITIEDTLELPVADLRDLGFNIQSMKVASSLATDSTEVKADVGIRTTLRLGDSALIVGEVRSKEAISLYEAMRVGAAANVVAGTIHGDSPFGVYDRVVNDIGIPKTSFKATDIVIVANPVRSADGIHRYRRVTQITEVRKHWQDDPMLEKGFVDLMRYDAKKDSLDVTDEVVVGDSDVLKSIAANVKEFAGNWDAVWDNIMLRAKIKQTLADTALKTNDPDMLEAGFVIDANDQFHIITDRVKEEVGSMDSQQIFYRWNEWLKAAVKQRNLR